MKSHRQSVATTLEEVPIDGREATIEFTRVTVTTYDPHYGADADGNRGIGVWEVDEDYAEGVTVQFEGDLVKHVCLLEIGHAGNCAWGLVRTLPFGARCHQSALKEQTRPLDSLSEGQRALVTAAVDAYIATHDPEVIEEDDEPPYWMEDR